LTNEERVPLGQRLKSLPDANWKRFESTGNRCECGSESFTSRCRLAVGKKTLRYAIGKQLSGCGLMVGAAEHEDRPEVGVFDEHYGAFFGAGITTNVDRSEAARKGYRFPLDESSGENGVDVRAAAAAGKVKNVAIRLAHDA
jgi:hypothetical protein